MNEPPATGKKSSLRSKVITGAAVGILAVGFWLGTLFNGFGLGTGESGNSEGDDATGGTSAELAPEDLSVNLGNPSLTRAEPPTEAVDDGPAEMIAVLIKGDGFGILKNPPANVSELAPPLSQHFTAATLDEVVAAATAATGNSGGVKVQIVKHKSSTVGRDSEWRSALRNAGLPDDAIHVYTGSHD